MDLIAVAIFDTQMKAYMRPFFVQAVGAAVRNFGDEVGNKESPMNRHPEDYLLFELGHFSEESGQLVSLDVPRLIARALDYGSK